LIIIASSENAEVACLKFRARIAQYKDGYIKPNGRDKEGVKKMCNYCNISPYGDTQNIKTQNFNDKTISNIKLNSYNTSLLTADTWNTPNGGAKMYTITAKINFCPICVREFNKEIEK